MPLADAPERYTRMYRREQVALRPNTFVDGLPAYDAEWFRTCLWDHLDYQQKLPHTLELPTGFDLQDLTALYYGMTTLVDDQVGKLVDALAKSDLLEYTILLFTADHGDDLGSHGGFNKCRLGEESIRVPLVIHWPSQLRPAHVTTQVASLVDVMPTLPGLASKHCRHGWERNRCTAVHRSRAPSEYAPSIISTPPLCAMRRPIITNPKTIK